MLIEFIRPRLVALRPHRVELERESGRSRSRSVDRIASRRMTLRILICHAIRRIAAQPVPSERKPESMSFCSKKMQVWSDKKAVWPVKVDGLEHALSRRNSKAEYFLLAKSLNVAPFSSTSHTRRIYCSEIQSFDGSN
jgi:hypothetical protein